jgi:hypothetical protein
MQDVVIEQLDQTEATVIASTPVARGEQMLLHVDESDGETFTLVVEGLERRAVVVDGQMRHRLRLRVVERYTGQTE